MKKYLCTLVASLLFSSNLSASTERLTLTPDEVGPHITKRSSEVTTQLNKTDSQLEKAMVATNFSAELFQIGEALFNAGVEKDINAQGMVDYAIRTLEESDEISIQTKAEFFEEMAYVVQLNRKAFETCMLRSIDCYTSLEKTAQFYGKAPDKLAEYLSCKGYLYQRLGHVSQADYCHLKSAELLFRSLKDKQFYCVDIMFRELEAELSQVSFLSRKRIPLLEWAQWHFNNGELTLAREIMERSFMNRHHDFLFKHYLLLAYMHHLEKDTAGARLYITLLERKLPFQDEFFYEEESTLMEKVTNYLTYGYLCQKLNGIPDESMQRALIPQWNEDFEKMVMFPDTCGGSVETIFGMLEPRVLDDAKETYATIKKLDDQTEERIAGILELDQIIAELQALPILKNEPKDAFEMLDEILKKIQ